MLDIAPSSPAAASTVLLLLPSLVSCLCVCVGRLRPASTCATVCESAAVFCTVGACTRGVLQWVGCEPTAEKPDTFALKVLGGGGHGTRVAAPFLLSRPAATRTPGAAAVATLPSLASPLLVRPAAPCGCAPWVRQVTRSPRRRMRKGTMRRPRPPALVPPGPGTVSPRARAPPPPTARPRSRTPCRTTPSCTRAHW